MQTTRQLRVVLASRPEGRPSADNFRFEEHGVPRPAEGQMLLETLYLSLDPYMRGRMNAAKSYTKPVDVGAVMEGGTVSRVLESKLAQFAPGDLVLSYSGWQTHALSDGKGVRKLDPSLAPVSTSLGVLGMPGFTAYVGMRNIGKPKPGETVVVAAATGPVGSAVGQIARMQGARAIGIAGGAEKCAALREEFGFDVALDHRSPTLAEELRESCPKGVDVYFENVGGAVFDAVLPLLNLYARVPVCGLVAYYNMTSPPAGPDRAPRLMREILTRSLTLRGFIQWEFADQEADFLRDMGTWVKDGRVRYREDVADGLESAPEAFIGLLEGRNFGKLLVRVAQ